MRLTSGEKNEGLIEYTIALLKKRELLVKCGSLFVSESVTK